MANIVLPPEITVDTDAPVGMEGQPGSRLKSAYAYADYFNLNDGDVINTLQMDFVSPVPISLDKLRLAIAGIWVPVRNEGEVILAYALHEKTLFDVAIPNQFCINIPGFGENCWTPPFAGETVFTAYEYRLWILTKSTARAQVAVRGLGPAIALVIIVGVVAVFGLVAALWSAKTGETTWREAADYAKRILTAPGEAVGKALTGPLIALGFTMAATAVLLPAISSKVGVKAGPVTTEIAARPPRPTPAQRRR